MSETSTPRKLATIVALDVAGYSARTEADEARTTSEVAALRPIIEGIAARHGGRVFNTAGDGFMLEFGSSLAAVEAAFELAETCEPKVRVGVHLGDVVVQANGDLLGHGVNVAARLMAQSQPGSALVSADVRRTIRGPLAERLISRGSLKLDKMAETIEAFALVAIAVAAHPKSVETLLAVLPFDNLSSDPEMQFLSDGISEEILQVLTHGGDLKVIGRTSAFQFRGGRKAEAARALRATHILDGAVRKSGSRLRVNVQLTEGGGGVPLWSDHYDREIADAFVLQDDIASNVAKALQSVFAPRKPAQQVDPVAYELFLRAREAASVVTDAGFRRATQLLEECVARAPAFAQAWAMLGSGRALLLLRDEDSVGTPQHTSALAAVQRAQELDPSLAGPYRTLAILKPAFAEHGEKIRLSKRGMDLAPNEALSSTNLAGALATVGRFREAVPHILRAASLEPMSPFNAGAGANSLFVTGRHEEAMAMNDDAIARQPPHFMLLHNKFNFLHALERYTEAAAFLDAELATGVSPIAEFSGQLQFLLRLPTLSDDARHAIFRSLLEPSQDPVLRVPLCQLAARWGSRDLAYEHLFRALESGRPIGLLRSSQGGINRAYLLANFYISKGLCLDTRFPSLCARVGLVEYWRESGHWPDCAEEVPYDFKVECEKAARAL